MQAQPRITPRDFAAAEPAPRLAPQALGPAAPLAVPKGCGGLAALLDATARRHPARPAFRDLADRTASCGRPAMTWTYGAAAEIVARLAHGLRTWRLPPGSRVGLWFAGGSEGLVAHLAVEAAGHVPCPMPAGWSEAEAVAGVEAAGIAAVLTQGRLGERRPAEAMRRVALQVFGLRYLAAFGPDVPDGVINLDALALERGGHRAAPPESGGGLVSFAGRDPARPVYRPGDALRAAIAVHLAAAPVGPGDRLLTLMPPDDLRGLVTGLGAALVAGAGLETLPVFDAAAFAAALAIQGERALHLAIPGFLESALRDRPLPTGLRSLTLAHRAPGRLTERRLERAAGYRIVDAVALDEDAVIVRGRGADDIALALADPAASRMPAGLLELATGPEGAIALRGEACRAAPLCRGATPLPEAQAWYESPYRATLFAGTATGLVRS